MYDSPTTGRPLLEYTTSFPGPWNSFDRARTPFTKRITKSGKIYLTDSPGSQIQEASQPFDIQHASDLVTHEEWQTHSTRQHALEDVDIADLSTGTQASRLQHMVTKQTRPAQGTAGITRTPAYASDASGNDSDYQLPMAKAKPIPHNTVSGVPNRADDDESDFSGDDSDYQLPTPKAKPKAKRITSDRADVVAQRHSSVPKVLTARQQSKQPQRERALSEVEEEEVPLVSVLRQGRLTKDVTKLMESFGESTRRRAQELATIHGVNFATVMRLAGLGAGTGTRASSECNTFKSIYAAQIFSDTGGESTMQSWSLQ